MKDGTVTRNLMVWDMFYNYHGKVDIEFAKMMWRFPGPSKPEWKTTVIGRSGNEHIVVAKPDNGDKGVAYICTGPAALEMYPNGWSPAISSTHSFYKLNLAATPQEVVEKARFQARLGSRNAYKMLMRVKYKEPGYRVVNDLYSSAMAELYQGDYARNKSMVTSGDEELKYCAQATTEYCKAQAHFQQLINLLNPPPTTPEDLGLKPWGFWKSAE
jgi:hypothetical protein